MDALAKVLEGAAALLWPILAAIVVLKLLPSLMEIAKSRGFTVEMGGMKVSVQEISNQLRSQLEDLQKKVSELRGVAAAVDQPTVSAATQAEDKVRRILWVDDNPENNALEIANFRDKGIEVVTATSTADAMGRLLADGHAFSVVISDLARREEGQNHPKAGIELIKAINDASITVPVIVYSSGPFLSRNRDAVKRAGGLDATDSPVELYEMVHKALAPT
jgi:CheY-like chemotaxis protein